MFMQRNRRTDRYSIKQTTIEVEHRETLLLMTTDKPKNIYADQQMHPYICRHAIVRTDTYM